MHPTLAVDIHQMIRKVTADLESQLRATRSEVTLRLASGLPYVFGNKELLQQTLRILLKELLTSRPGLSRRRRLFLRSHLSPRSFYLVIEVNQAPDQGTLTSPFADPSDEIDPSSVYDRLAPLLTRLRGDLRILPWRNATLAVILRLPRVVESNGKSRGAGARRPLFSGERILVVDDEEIVLDLLQAVLGRWGLRVETASDGREAVSKVRRHDFDLILSDIKMPNLDGKGLYSVVRRIQPQLADRIIFSTGDTASESTATFLDRVGNPYLSKPFDMEDLKLTIARMLAVHHGRKPNS